MLGIHVLGGPSYGADKVANPVLSAAVLVMQSTVAVGISPALVV